MVSLFNSIVTFITFVYLGEYLLDCSLLTIYYLPLELLIITIYLICHHFYYHVHICRTLNYLHERQPSYHLALPIGLYFKWAQGRCSSSTRSSVMISCHWIHQSQVQLLTIHYVLFNPHHILFIKAFLPDDVFVEFISLDW
jgi:hypothetical protein